MSEGSVSARRGLIISISGPSGSGKGTLINRASAADGNLCYSVSATTREMRFGEAEGVNYYYKTENEFDALIEKGDVLEWDSFCGHRYGTLRSELESKISAGCDVILDLTVPGSLAIKEAFPEDAITVFILPPSFEALESRIRGRQRETEEQLEKRVESAKKEVFQFDKFDYVLVNGDLREAVENLLAIIKAERLSYKRNKNILERLDLKGAIV